MTRMTMLKGASEANLPGTVDPSQEKLRNMLEERGLIRGEIVLSTGQTSDFYFDCKRITLSPEGASLVADAFLREIDRLPKRPQAIGGLTHGADPIIGAIQMRALEHGRKFEAFYVRKEKKRHGTMQRIENPPEHGTDVVIVDDVVTTGRSVVLAIQRARDIGANVVGVIALVDREQGGSTAIKSECQEYRAIYHRRDFPKLQALERANER